MKRYYCTYFDHRYLDKGMALYQSMHEHCHDFFLFVLCLSYECYTQLQGLKLPRVILISLKELESWDNELLTAKKNRSLIEYYFTCSPSLPLFIFDHFPQVDLITYLDSDLFFFTSPEPLFEELGSNSIAIIGHKFPTHFKHLEDRGKYNVGWISYRKDPHGMHCLEWYREKCIEWCYDRVEDGRFADQKYLDYFPDKFSNVIELQHKGANLAPWNISNYKLTQSEPNLKVDNEQLIFFHFHGIKHVIGPLYDSGLAIYQVEMDKIIRNNLYKPYAICLHNYRTRMRYSSNNSLRSGAIYQSQLKDVCRYFKSTIKNNGLSLSALSGNPYIISWGNTRSNR